ncbi:MAG: hypothetical protein JWQ87_807 [Candidatus Sulfotelmatobacter sp.]|nr:hypothetical protein [Candidatus Sulfotelmatobacter sp.]
MPDADPGDDHARVAKRKVCQRSRIDPAELAAAHGTGIATSLKNGTDHTPIQLFVNSVKQSAYGRTQSHVRPLPKSIRLPEPPDDMGV